MNDLHGDTDAALHVVCGAGQIGTRVAELLLARGHRVRLVRRGAAGPAREGLEWMSGDLTDHAFAEKVGRGASVVYDCMNPAYHQWPRFLLPMGRGTLHAARTSGAKLVALDCLYMYGRPEGPMTETTRMEPCSSKGRLRVELAALRLDAHRRGEVQVAIGRASDFFGPGIVTALFGERFFERIFAGKSGEGFGDLDLPHSYSYGPDVAEGLVTLGEHEEAFGHVWHLPAPPAESTRALAARLAVALGRPVPITSVSRTVLRAIGIVSPMLREAAEMTYQWEVPYVIDDTRFRGAFGVAATPIGTAVRETADWARARFDRRRAA